MEHDFSIVFETDSPYWQRVLDIFERNEKYEKKVVSNRNLHHKFPRSFSKSLGEPVDNDKDNLISLSLSEHFLVHYYYYLLAKKGYRQSMATAFRFMARKGLKFMTPDTAEAMAKDYAEAKAIADQYVGSLNKGRVPSEDARRKMSESNAWKGRHLPEDMRRKISAAAKGENNHFFGKSHTAEARLKIAAANKGKHLSEETKRKISATRKAKKRGEEV